LDERGLRAIIVCAPENVFYLTGLEHQGYFAYEALIVPLQGDPILVTRAMEKATVRDQVPWVQHAGYSGRCRAVAQAKSCRASNGSTPATSSTTAAWCSRPSSSSAPGAARAVTVC